MLLVVVEDLLDRLDTRVLIALVIFAGSLLVPIKDLERLCGFQVTYAFRNYSHVQRTGK